MGTNAGQADVKAFFDESSHTVTYLVSDPLTRAAAIIDPVLDYDHASGKVAVRSADTILAAVTDGHLKLEWVLETHAHADHLSAAPYLRDKTGAKIGIGEHIRAVQTLFRPVFNLEDLSETGAEFDRLFADGERFSLGELTVEVMHTPGHTPACVSYRIDSTVFVGDTLFMPDYGTARADFPGGNAESLYRSIQRLLALPDDTAFYVCHDYLPAGRHQFAWKTTVKEERENNIHVHLGVSERQFVEMRRKRDSILGVPALLLPSVQVNVRGGRLPRAESNGVHYLKIPMQLPRAVPESE
jgi:glyoxylase-like metal-dependent hydrolase (beta-lactamase superfamily II)